MFFQDGIGIEIGERQAAVVQARRFLGLPRVAREALLPLDAGAGEEERMAALADGLKALLAEWRAEDAAIHLGVPQAKVMVRRMLFPMAARENLADAVRFEMGKLVPVPADELYWDFHPLGEDRESQRLQVVVVAGRRTDLKPYARLAEGLGSGVGGMAPSIFCLRNLMAPVNGGRGCGISVVAWGDAGRLDLAAPWAARSLGLPDTADGRLVAVASGLGGLLRGMPIKAVTVHCGGPALADLPLGEEENPGAPVRYRRLALEAQPVSGWEFLPAYALALAGLQAPSLPVNLLPAEWRRRPPRLARYLTAGLALLALAGAAGWAGSMAARQHMAEQRIEADLERLGPEVARVDGLLRNLEEIRGRIGFLQATQAQSLPVLEALRELTDIIPDSAWVRELTLAEGKLRLDGYADAASDLLPILDASARLRDVAFASPITRERDGKEKFRITCSLEGAAGENP